MDEHQVNEIRALIERAQKDGFDPAMTLFQMGYRQDPFPAGKSKQELIAIIDQLQAKVDRATNLLRGEHRKVVILAKKHPEGAACSVCDFMDGD